MPKLIIDHREIEVAKGTKVIEAAQMLGIMIPRFCYHEAMGSIGACRVCAVKFVDGPVKGVQMSCMENAADGMVVSTTDPEAMEFRRYVIEWLMMNHPLDCPVCDEGGHCLLQDETVSGGHSIRRYLGKKRTYHDQYLGPFVQHEMNRCIHCLRCRRFYQDYAGYHDLGARNIGSRTYFGRWSDGSLESPFSGNLIDVCPTGVFTDKPARFRSRRWNLERAPSVCTHCSLGCNTTGSGRYREMLRQEARTNQEVNGYFICDRGRFGFDFANHPDRPRIGRVRGKETPVEEAVGRAGDELIRIRRTEGPGAIACLGSSRSSLETQAWLKRFCGMSALAEPRYFLDPLMENKVRRAVHNLDARMAISMREVEGADFILVAGADPIHEAPMLALAMRQAQRTVVSNVQTIQQINMMDPVKRSQRKGANVVVIDPRPVFLPLEFYHLPVLPGRIDQCMAALVRDALSPGAPERAERTRPGSLEGMDGQRADTAALSEILRRSKRPVFICGTDIVRETTIDLTVRLVRLLRGEGKEAGLFYVLPGPNAFGAALLSPADEREPLIEAIERGAVRALVLVENDPFLLYPDRERLERAFQRLDLLLVLDYLPSPSVERAHIVLPTTTVFEHGPSCFVNQEGRLQSASPVHKEGTPIQQLTGGNHPPRTYSGDIPGGEPRPASELLQALASRISGPGTARKGEDIWLWLGRQDPIFKGALSASARSRGVRLLRRGRPEGDLEFPGNPPKGALKGMSAALERPDDKSPPLLELLLVDRTFGTEELSNYSRHTRKAEEEPALLMHPERGDRSGLKDGEPVRVSLDRGGFDIRVRFAKNMAREALIVPRHRDLAWQKIKAWPARISVNAIEKDLGS